MGDERTNATAAAEALTIDDVARLLRLSTRTVYQLVARGELHASRAGRAIRVHREAVDAWLRGGSQP